MRILLEGRPGSGKSTIARRLADTLTEMGIPVTGFVTEEIRERGRRIGFSIERFGGERGVLAHVDLPGPPRVGRYGVDLSELERLAIPALREATDREVAIVDELGKMELASQPFRLRRVRPAGAGRGDRANRPAPVHRGPQAPTRHRDHAPDDRHARRAPAAARDTPREYPMKRLYLLRHAKSSWKDTSLPDHDRPLAGRGRRAAKAIARHLREQDLEPQLVLCSTARRARETLDRIQPALGAATVELEHDLYAASADALLERLRRVPDTVASVMLIGHNPGLQELALDLAGSPRTVSELATKLPTAALATLEIPASNWQELDHKTAEIVAFVRPRDLD